SCESTSVKLTRAGLSLTTILSIIDEIAAYQATYLSTEEQIDFFHNNFIFQVCSSSANKCIDIISEREWLTDKWKRSLIEWADPEQLRAMQYQREEGGSILLMTTTSPNS
ncbi:hypothetical protein PENTCL1PPCAC_16366, partial [Pristionchus entomophagus]